MLDGIWQGIKNGWNGLVEAVKELAGELLSGIKETLGIHSPSRVFRDEVGKMLDLGLAEGITGNIDEVNKAVATLNDSTMAGIESDIAVSTRATGSLTVDASPVTLEDGLGVIIELLNRYLPDCAEPVTIDERSLTNGINRRLGMAVM